MGRYHDGGVGGDGGSQGGEALLWGAQGAKRARCPRVTVRAGRFVGVRSRIAGGKRQGTLSAASSHCGCHGEFTCVVSRGGREARFAPPEALSPISRTRGD